MGTLRIRGTLDPQQFFPNGESDGDTAHLLAEDFAFSEAGQNNFTVTTVFEGAKVGGRAGRKPVIDNKGRITIRFQGIDAPELHFRPTFTHLPAAVRERVNTVAKQFRQFFGEAAAVALRKLLYTLNSGAPVSCEVLTDVEAPNDVCDTYGRVVADIIADPEGQCINLNQWLVENGWAFPAFYNSMSPGEITTLCDLAGKARKYKRGIWAYPASTVVFPDPDLIYEKHVERTPDQGRVLFPKYFRRSCNWYVTVKAHLKPAMGFKAFLAMQQEPDRCYLTQDFLDNGATSADQHPLTDFIESSGHVTQPPDGLVFKEAKSTLYDANGAKVQSFWPAGRARPARGLTPAVPAAGPGI